MPPSSEIPSAMPFAGNPLDRASEKRKDAHWLARARADRRALTLVLWNTQPLLRESAGGTVLAILGAKDVAGLAPGAPEIFLGLDGEVPYFARDVSALAEDDPALARLGRLGDARAATAILPLPETALLGQAKALIDWHRRHLFCARCGSATAAADGGYRRLCPVCKAEHFPRTDPCVIMLVTLGDECLLARNKRFAGGHYSTLAGFVEPGETIEEAVVRETYEEVRVRVGAVRYVASQPWPFPSNLMLGCFAHAETHDIVVDGEEIVTARWFDRATMKKLISGESTEIGLPRRDAIAFHLMQAWVEAG
jgi:NAD+ diphosphatase